MGKVVARGRGRKQRRKGIKEMLDDAENCNLVTTEKARQCSSETKRSITFYAFKYVCIKIEIMNRIFWRCTRVRERE